MSSEYDDLLNLPHHTSTVQPAMPIQNRAAQFAPFAALVGYDALIQETTRLTDQKAELDESVKAELNEKLRLLLELMPQQPEVTITYFLIRLTASLLPKQECFICKVMRKSRRERI